MQRRTMASTTSVSFALVLCTSACGPSVDEEASAELGTSAGTAGSTQSSTGGETEYTEESWDEYCRSVPTAEGCGAQEVVFGNGLRAACGWSRWRELIDPDSCEVGPIVVEECRAAFYGPEGQPVGRRCVPTGDYACLRDDLEFPAVGVSDYWGCQAFMPCVGEIPTCECACDLE